MVTKEHRNCTGEKWPKNYNQGRMAKQTVAIGQRLSKFIVKYLNIQKMQCNTINVFPQLNLKN